MIVFKTYFKILKQNIGVILLYTMILLVFTVFNTTSGNGTQAFEATKPGITIINNDKDSKVIKNLKKYLKENADIVKIENDKEKLDDALFYRDTDAILYIYDGYTEDYLNNQEKKLDVKFTTDSSSAHAKMLLERYFKLADIANNNIKDEEAILKTLNTALHQKTNVLINNKLDTDNLTKAGFFYNFANYSMLAVCIYVVALILNTFNKEVIKKRNVVSSKKSSSLTRELFLSNLVFSLIVWAFVVISSLILLGEIMFTMNGLFLIINSLVFTFTALSIGFLIGNIVNSKEAVNGISNVVALGSSFLCGCFIPIEFLPATVNTFAKVFPSYWYIHNNNVIKTIEVFNLKSIQPVLINMLIVLLFGIGFFVITVFYNKKKRQV